MLSTALSSIVDELGLLLGRAGGVEKRSVMENLDLVLLGLDEAIDDGYVLPSSS